MLEVPDAEPKPDPHAAEVKRAYHEAISRATKFLISSAIILLILVVVVGQELREYQKKQDDLTNQFQTASREKGDLVRNLEKKREVICKGLEPLQAVKTKEGGQPEEHDLDVIQQLAKGCEKRKPRADEPEREFSIPRIHSVRKAKDIDVLVKNEQKLGGSVEALKQELPTSQKKGQTRQVITLLIDYHELYQKFIDASRELFNVTTESQGLERTKNAIPTPFGDFQIAPKLAILGLSYATIITYLSFLSLIRKIRGLATEYDQATSAQLYIPPPFWSPSHDPQSGSILTAVRRHFAEALPSIMLHLIWLALASWLTVETVFRWNATKALEFDYRDFWGYLLMAFLAVALFGAVWQFTPALQRLLPRIRPISRAWSWLKGLMTTSKQPVEQGGSRINRRRFVGLAVGSLGMLGVLGLGAFRLLRASKRIAPRLSLAQFVGTLEPNAWIQNIRPNKKGMTIIHYKPICGAETRRGHLPKRFNVVTSLAKNVDSQPVHADCQAHILETLGMEAKKTLLRLRGPRDPATRLNLGQQERDQGALAINYFHQALTLSPLSLHLYDELRKMYGTLGLYDKIKPLLEDGLGKVQSEIKLVQASSLARKARKLELLRRAENEFKSRILTTEKRKKKAEEWKAKSKI